MSPTYKTPLCPNCDVNADWEEPETEFRRLDANFVQEILVEHCKACDGKFSQVVVEKVYKPE